jgi:hypothetical protein
MSLVVPETISVAGFPHHERRANADAGPGRRDDDAGMSYAVTWSDDGGSVFAGSLEVAETGLSLAGTSPFACESHQQVLYVEVAEIRRGRRPRERLMGRPTLVVERRDGTCLRISALSGAGILNEIAERVSDAGEQAGDRALITAA